MEKLNYSELLQPVIEEISRDIDADNRSFEEPANALLVLSAQISTDKDGEDEMCSTLAGNLPMIAFMIAEEMRQDEEFLSIIQMAIDIYRENNE